MRTIVFVNGQVDDYVKLAHWLEPDDTVVCADGGVYHALALNVVPDAVVGDMDSIDQATLARLMSDGIPLERHPRQKNQTDLELALDRAIRDGADEVLILAAVGGRLDQTLSNLLIVAQREWSVPIRVAANDQMAELLRGGETLTLQAQVGAVVSLIPLSGVVTGITYTGLEYNLADVTLKLGSTRAVSNVVQNYPATITIRSGLAIITQTML